jgi:hypothetical protein
VSALKRAKERFARDVLSPAESGLSMCGVSDSPVKTGGYGSYDGYAADGERFALYREYSVSGNRIGPTGVW